MGKHRDFAPHDELPATFLDSLVEYLSTGAFNIIVRLKAGTPAVVEVPAGVGNALVGLAIDSKFRYITATVEQAGAGGARNVDIYATSTANSFTYAQPGELDNTNYAFALAVVNAGAAPVGVAHSRKIATAFWDGAKFTQLVQIVPPLGVHGASHDPAGADPLTYPAVAAFLHKRGAPGAANAANSGMLNYDPDTLAFERSTGAVWEDLLAGGKVKVARVVATVNVNVAAAPAAIDAVNLVNGNKVLLAGQNAGAQNGHYVFNGAGAAMTRATESNTSAKIVSPLLVVVTEGDDGADSLWMLLTDGAINLGVTALAYGMLAQVGAQQGGGGAGTPAMASAKNAGAVVAIGAGTLDLPLNVEEFDNAAIHDMGSNTHRMTCPTAGLWNVRAHLATNTNAQNRIDLCHSTAGGAVTVLDWVDTPGTLMEDVLEGLRQCAAGDYFFVRAARNLGQQYTVDRLRLQIERKGA